MGLRNLYLERRALHTPTEISRDIARHLYARQPLGKIVVVALEPFNLMRVVSKQRLRVVRQMRRERSSTLNPVRIQELANQVACMQALRFSARPDDVNADVAFAAPPQLLATPPQCPTLYITCAIGHERMNQLTCQMPRHALVVMYDHTAERRQPLSTSGDSMVK